jgi:hypothetical protein
MSAKGKVKAMKTVKGYMLTKLWDDRPLVHASTNTFAVWPFKWQAQSRAMSSEKVIRVEIRELRPVKKGKRK